jgi:hypothetical protein
VRTFDADRAVGARHEDGPVRYCEDAPVEAAAAAFGVPLRELDLAAVIRRRPQSHDDSRARPAGTVRHMSRRLLIASGEAAGSIDALPFGVRTLIDAADEIMVIAPRLPGRLDWLTSDTDSATERADARLGVVLGQLAELGTPARGHVGADEPLLAFEDAVREFAPDHLLIAMRSGDRAGWQERGLLERVEERFGLPLTVFALPDER